MEQKQQTSYKVNASGSYYDQQSGSFLQIANISNNPSLDFIEMNNNDSIQIISDLNVIIENVELKELLKTWKLEHLYTYLISEKVTVEILKILKAEHVKELIQKLKMGDRASFEYHLENWRDEIGIPLSILRQRAFLGDYTNSSPASTFRRSPSQTSSTSYSLRNLSPEPMENEHVTLSVILNESQKGSIIKNFYVSNKKLNDAHRSLLISIIANYFESNNIRLSLQTSYRLEREIIQAFPNEKLNFYRTEKRGKIYSKYCNLKRGLKSFSNTNNSNNDEQQRNATKSIMLNKIVPEKDAKQHVRSLKYDNLSSEEFDSLWQSSSHYRIHQIWNECDSIQQIFKLWPEYKKTSSCRLIDKDFGAIFPDYGGLLQDGEIKVKQIYLFLMKDRNIKDTLLKAICHSISKEDVESGTISYMVKTLWCLHGYLLPSSKTVRKDITGKKETSRFTIKDSQESFLFIGQTLQHLEDHLGFLQRRGENIQPFILTVADTEFSKFNDFFLYLDGTKIPFNNFLRYVDVCFKIFHLFNLEYPKACSEFWIFIELYFYKLGKSAEKKSSKVSILLEELKNSMLQ